MNLFKLPGSFVPGRKPTVPNLRLTRRWSWMNSGWFKTLELGPDGGGTASLTLGCPVDFVAARIGFANMTTVPWRVTHAIASASDHVNDYVEPVGSSRWTTLAVTNPQSDAGTTGSHGSTEIIVRGVDDTSRAGSVAWTWTDWAPIRSLAPDPATGMRTLMVRALLAPNQNVTYALGQFRQFTGNPVLNHGHDIFLGGLRFNIDVVTDPHAYRPPTQTWVANQLVTGTIFPIVQLMTQQPGISGIAAGDSHIQGTSTAEEFSSFLLRATASLGRQYRGKVPFGMVNCAEGGLESDTFFARLESMIDAVEPSYAILPGWTFNDATDGIHADQAAMDVFLFRLLSVVEICRTNGILPIILTPFPRDRKNMGDVQMAPWRRLRTQLLELRASGAIVIDATTILGQRKNGEFDGTYLPSLTTDTVHPNDQGHIAIANALVKTVRSLV